MTNFVGAFDCASCPQNADPAQGRACPMFWETVYTEPSTGKIDIVRACGYTQLPRFLIEVIRASNRPAASIDKVNNTIAGEFSKMETLLAKTLAVPAFSPSQPRQFIEYRSGTEIGPQ